MLLVGQGALAASASGTPMKPPGNNGTIKIGTAPVDDVEQKNSNNHPHVACTFYVQWFNFDSGLDKDVTVAFVAHPPSGSTPVAPLIGPSAFSFSTSATSRLYKLDTTGLTLHPNQGYHIKVTIHAEGSQGNDTKSKVFWVQPCAETSASASASSSASSSASASQSASASASESASQSASASASESASASASESVTPSVEGTQLTSPTISPTVLGVKITKPTGGLPFTGMGLPPLTLILVGLALATLGAVMASGSRSQGAHQR
jgi:hypothetical protein